jgi:hypothetical protein
MPDHIVIEKITVDKSDRKLMVYADGSVIKTFAISLGDQPIGPKERDGDGKTPEGEYIIHAKSGKGSSRYYKNLGVSYPSSKDEKMQSVRDSNLETVLKSMHYKMAWVLLEDFTDGRTGPTDV